jgi:dinuclear metal center YbgI/SA1388 family protein
VRLSDLVLALDGFWPPSQADDWDRVGLTSGNPSAEIEKVLVSVDLTEAVIEEAIANGCQLIVTHHPALLRGVNSLVEDELKGALMSRLIKAGIANLAAHTNADVQKDGATSILAELLGLIDVRPIVENTSGFGHGAIGTLPDELTLGEFSKRVSECLPKTARAVSFSGQALKPIRRVAICSGAGDSFIPAVISSDADVYVTSDLRHHPTLDAIETPRENGPLALIDVSHWASESLWVTGAVMRISGIPGLVAFASQISTDPWTEEVN